MTILQFEQFYYCIVNRLQHSRNLFTVNFRTEEKMGASLLLISSTFLEFYLAGSEDEFQTMFKTRGTCYSLCHVWYDTKIWDALKGCS
jgi:hypothetical protein